MTYATGLLYNKATIALYYAAAAGDLAEVRRLLEVAEVNPHAKDKKGHSAPYYAALGGHTAVAAALLEHCAKLHT